MNIKDGMTVIVKHPSKDILLIAIVTSIDGSMFLSHSMVKASDLSKVTGMFGGMMLRISDIKSIIN
jgi:hypothetical protein